MAQRLRRSTCMDTRLRESMIGRCWQRRGLPTLAQRELDEMPDADAHTHSHTSLEGEIHPELFADEATRERLGFDPIPAE